MIGKTLAHYQILEKIGAGGMGEVFRARDTSLDRDVAIKVLPEAFTSISDRLARFEREAKLLASLNHPRIATVHGLHHVDGVHFLAMELVPGTDLTQRLERGPLAMEDALHIALQVAEALEAAHEHGVVHRDVKPSNIVITPDGDAKVLDFGLARSLEPEGSSGVVDLSHSPTLTSPATMAGVILGTAGYMSPEQARGMPVDRRADVWAFGVVLFEMLTGKRLFEGETVSDTLASILKSEPDWSRLPPSTSHRLRELMERCLAKDPRKRLRDMGDARLDLEWIRDGRGTRPGVESAGRRPRAIPALIGAAAAGALIGILAWSLRPDSGPATSGPSEPVRRLDLVFPNEMEFSFFSLPFFHPFLLSPDGRTLAMVGRPRKPATAEEEVRGVYLRPIDGYETRFVPGSRGVAQCCFSADGRWLAITAPAEPKSTNRFLWMVPVDGSAPPLKLRDWAEEWDGLLWLPDGDLITTTAAREVVRIHTDGRPSDPPVPIHLEGFESNIIPSPQQGTLLPDGRHVLCHIAVFGEQGYSQSVVVLDMETGEARTLIENGGSPRWSDTGHLLFSRGTTLLAVSFDPDRLAVGGGPTALVDDLRIDASWDHGYFDVSEDGTLVYPPGGFVGGSQQLVWMDRSFHELRPWSDARFALEFGPLASPDGRMFAVVIAGPDGVFDIWASETDRPALRRWVEEPGRDCNPLAWTRDGSRLVYESETFKEARYYIRPAGESGSRVLLFEDSSPEDSYRPTSFAGGDATLLVTHNRAGKSEIVALSVERAEDGSQPFKPLLADAADGKISPDDRWMVYESDTSGRWEVYLRRWNANGTLGSETRVSTDGGRHPRWYTPGGKEPFEIWYSKANKIYGVSVKAEPDVTLSRPELIVEPPPRYQGFGTVPDGRILMRVGGEEEGEFKRIHVVPGWARELKKGLAATP